MKERRDNLNQVFQEEVSAGLSSTTARRQYLLVVVFAVAIGLWLLAWPALRGDRWFHGDIERFYFPLRYELSRHLTW